MINERNGSSGIRKISCITFSLQKTTYFGQEKFKKYEDAIHKANDVLKIVARTEFKFYKPEAELILTKAYLIQGDKEKAKSLAFSSYEKAKYMHYLIVETEASQILTIGE